VEQSYAQVDDCLVDASPERCFDLVCEIRRYHEWWKLITCEPLGSEEILRVGSRFRFTGGRVSWIVEVAGLDRPARIDLRYAEGDLVGTVGWEFTAEGTGTRIAYVYRSVRPNSDYMRERFARGEAMRVHTDAMQNDAFAGLSRLLESDA